MTSSGSFRLRRTAFRRRREEDVCSGVGGDDVIMDVDEGVGCYDTGEQVEQRAVSRKRRRARVRLWHGGGSTCFFGGQGTGSIVEDLV